ncbi:MAG: hypothetical protein V1723_04105 [Candidatus Uhrbacteria bacterium]
MKPTIHPAIIATSSRDFHTKLRLVDHVAPIVQIDVMDGRFVPRLTWADPRTVARWPTPTRFEVHLMVNEPFADVAEWGRVQSVWRIIVHAESTRRLDALLKTVRATGKKVGLAINPSTPLRRILPHLADVDAVLLLANKPGAYGQPFRSSTLQRIAAIRRRAPKLDIGVDVGVNPTTVPLIRAAGATFGAAGSSVFGQPDPAAAYCALERAFRTRSH